MSFNISEICFKLQCIQITMFLAISKSVSTLLFNQGNFKWKSVKIENTEHIKLH